MVLYLKAESDILDLVVDFIGVKLQSGKIISLTWDESEFDREDGQFEARYKGVYFDDAYGNGRLSELKDMEVQHIELCSECEDVSSFSLRELSFQAGEDSLVFSYPECQTERSQVERNASFNRQVCAKSSTNIGTLAARSMSTAMANKAKEKSSREMLVEEIRDLGRTHGVNTVFTNFLELTALALAIIMDPVNRVERQKSYEELERSLDREALSAYGRMTTYLSLAIREYRSDPKDILGEVYSKLRLSSEWNGQFFTPDSISRLMAKILQASGDISERKEYVTMNEPACGSGTMIYGTAWTMQKNRLNYQKKSLLVAQDIDIRCVWMTYIQCCLYRIPVVVIHGNTLTQEEWSCWYSKDALKLLATDAFNGQADGKQPSEACTNEKREIT